MSAGADDELARDLAELLDDLPSFGSFVDIKTKEDGLVDFGWDRWHPEQQQFERERTGRDLIVKSRKIGFSTLELLRDLQFARTHDGVQVLIVTHTGDVKVEFFSALKLMEQTLRERWGLCPRPTEDTATSLRWDDNHSSIRVIEAGKTEATAANRSRSGTVGRLHCTEAAFYAAPDATMTALLGAVEDRECVIESTPNGIGNWFHAAVSKAEHRRFEDFKLHFFPWFQHPTYRAKAGRYPEPDTARARDWERRLVKLGCDAEQLSWWRGKVSGLTLDGALQEFPPTLDAAFNTSAETWIDSEHLEALSEHIETPTRLVDLTITNDAAELVMRSHGALRIYREPRPGAGYLLIVDPSGGNGGDEAAMKVLETRSGDDVASWHGNRTSPADLGHIAAKVGRLFNGALIVVERNEWRKRNGNGEGRETLWVLEREERYSRIYRADDGKLGWSTNAVTRPLVWEDTRRLIIDRLIRTPDKRTVDEIKSIVIDEETREVHAKGKGKPGGSDDGLFMCLGIGHQVRQRIPTGRGGAQSVGALESTSFQT